MADENLEISKETREDISGANPKYDCVKDHKREVAKVRRAGRLTVLWSFISLFFVYGDMTIGVDEGNRSSGEAAIVWGIPIIGITEETFLFFLLIMTMYYMVNFVFVIVRVHIMSNSWQALKVILCMPMSEKDKAWSEIELEEEVEQQFAGKNTEGSDEQKAAEAENRELIRLMIRYRLMGFLEYFFAPIFFPAVLCLWALGVLVSGVCR